MALPDFSMRQLLEAGVHFGHQTQRWNPRMGPYIYGDRNGIHILDLTQTVEMLDAALNVVRETVAKGGRILFVGTKRQAQKPIAEAAERCAQYYMNHRWLGGTLTNWKTVSNSISRLKEIDEKMAEGVEGLTKKERLGMERDQAKLQASLGGIREMGGLPDLIFVIDVNKEDLAIAEARKLGIPVVAVVDTNCSPDGVDYIIPGNDDAARAIALYCDLVSRAALDGMSAQLETAGVDLGSLEEGTVEEALAAETTEEPAAEAEVQPEAERRRRRSRTRCRRGRNPGRKLTRMAGSAEPGSPPSPN
jgi:small subunit ribosomal protein S2